jgi:hypothetical protein
MVASVEVRFVRSRVTQQMQLLFEQRAKELKRRVAEKLADRIVDLSPVDTGTYVMAHIAATGDTGEAATRRSAGKKRGQNPTQFKNLARGNLKRSVSSAAVLAGNEIWFRNRAEHADRVEYTGWSDKGGRGADHVYALAKAEFNEILRETLSEIGMRAT